MGMDLRSSYTAVPLPLETGSSVRQDSVPGHARGRHLRITGAASLILLASAACAAAWLGGARQGRVVASLRSGVRLEEEKECRPYETNIDFRGLKELKQQDKVTNSKKCSEICQAEQGCQAWTWGKLRNVRGFSDVCFLKALIPGQKAKKYYRYGVVSGIHSDVDCDGEKEEPATVSNGHVKSRDGFCLEAKGSEVTMASCLDGKASQEWKYTEKTGQVKNQAGLCLDAKDRSRPFVKLQMYPCDSGNWSQQWMFDNDTGLIKSWRGSCIDAGERNIEGGMVYIQACDSGSENQKWLVGVSGNQPKLPEYDPGTLYCFALMLPHSYEQGLLKMQHSLGVSLFACDEWSVYSNQVIEVDDGVKSGVVNSDLKCGKGGEFGTALNLDIFLAVWTKVVSDAIFEKHDWTVKVDPDAVFFPDRLKTILSIHPEAKNGAYLNNCQFGMHGPVEVLSRNAVTAWAMGSPRCVQHFQKKCGGDCFWGEDLFVDQCLWKVLGVRRDNDFRLLLEDHCDPPKDWDDCTRGDIATFHPFKTQDGYKDCLKRAGEKLDAPPSHHAAAPSPPPPPPPPPPTTERTTEAPPTPKPSSTAPTPAPTPTPAKPHDSDELEGTDSSSESTHCHTARKGERCYVAVDWAMEFGIRLHPDWYEGLTSASSPYEFQKTLHGRPHVDCPMPCKEESS